MVTSVFSIPPTAMDRSRCGDFVDEHCRAARPPEFLAGPENQIIQQALASVTSDWARFNPLYVTGPSGVGKSHLTQALLAASTQRYPELKYLYFTGADYARLIAHALDVNSIRDLRVKLRRVDLLLVDDLSELAGKHPTQIELLHLLDHLSKNGSQLIVTAREEPSRLARFLPALSSRLEAGLVLRLNKPELTARREILKSLANALDLRLSDDRLQQLCETFDSSAHEPTVSQLKSMLLQSYALPKARLVSRVSTTGYTRILKAVAKSFHVPLSELSGSSRRKTVTLARAMATYVLRSRHDVSFQRIGRLLGGRDHTTILHAYRRAEQLLHNDSSFHHAFLGVIAALE